MSCHRICRELLWLARFGEFPPDSAPHLEHLSRCGACRDEIGFDRAMVQRLREALLARVGEANPSDAAWAKIVARAQTPDSPRVRIWEWSTTLVARLRVGTAVAFGGLALILTLNTELVPAGGPPSTSPTGATDAMGDTPFVGGLRNPDGRGQAVAARTDRGSGSSSAKGLTPAAAQRWEPFVPPAIGTQDVQVVEEEPVDPVEEPEDAGFVLVFELIEQPAPAAEPADEAEVPEPGPTPRNRQPGEPS